MDHELSPPPDSLPSRRTVWLGKLRSIMRPVLPVVLVLGSAFGGVALYNRFFPPPIPPSADEIDELARNAMASATPQPAYSSRVYQTILPSLVFIQTERETTAEDGQVGIGSGVVVNDVGDILTALHVVDGAIKIEIYFADGTQATASIISTDPEIDIAVLHPDQPPELIVPAVLASSAAMRVGDEAYAVGNPFGYTASMSAGVISGFNRSIQVGEDDQRLDGLIQFDTAVNPGSSGGPLLNRRGQVVGIVTAIASPSEGDYFIGIGFAIPINAAASAAGGPPY